MELRDFRLDRVFYFLESYWSVVVDFNTDMPFFYVLNMPFFYVTLKLL